MSVNLKDSETLKNLMRAFAGESQARNRYTFAAAVCRRQRQQHHVRAPHPGGGLRRQVRAALQAEHRRRISACMQQLRSCRLAGISARHKKCLFHVLPPSPSYSPERPLVIATAH